MTLVTREFIDFTASAVLENGKIVKNFNLKKFIKNEIAVLFFWPMDFTFVCPSELIALNNNYYDFKKRNVKIVGISIDSEFVHSAWRKIDPKNGGIGEVQYPMISDIKREIISSYKIKHPNLGVALRGTFLIDKKGIIRYQLVNDLPFGRNIKEILRMVDALVFHEENRLVCPAQWEKGDEGMTPSKDGVVQYLSKNFNKL